MPGTPQTGYPEAITEAGHSLHALAQQHPILLVFLRHWGCSFCRETLSDLSILRPTLEAQGVRLVFVHMGSPERARPYFDHYHLADIERIADPGQQLYRDPAFALPHKPTILNLFDPAVLKGWLTGIIRRHGISLHFTEDATQMPGVFLLSGPLVVGRYRYKSIADKPDFLKLARSATAKN